MAVAALATYNCLKGVFCPENGVGVEGKSLSKIVVQPAVSTSLLVLVGDTSASFGAMTADESMTAVDAMTAWDPVIAVDAMTSWDPVTAVDAMTSWDLVIAVDAMTSWDLVTAVDAKTAGDARANFSIRSHFS